MKSYRPQRCADLRFGKLGSRECRRQLLQPSHEGKLVAENQRWKGRRERTRQNGVDEIVEDDGWERIGRLVSCGVLDCEPRA